MLRLPSSSTLLVAMSLTPLDYAVAAAGGLLLIQWFLKHKPVAPLPPGPTGLPIVGNVADMPSKKEWLTYAEWGRKWGDILSVNILGRPMIIVNSAQIMDELDKRGSIYSDRPRLVMSGELVGYSKTLAVTPYSARFRSYRKYFSRHMGTPQTMGRHNHIVEHEARRFLRRTLVNPDNLNANLRKLAGGIIMQLTYGYEVQEGEDPFVDLIERALQGFNASIVPGAFLVDFFPSLRHLPEWLPGMGFMAIAREWAKDAQDMINIPFAYSTKQIASGTARPSFVTENLESEQVTAEEVEDVKMTASSMYGGGADTTVSSEYAFFLAMVLNPDVQKKAQAEIDAVIGNDRLPTVADRPRLPYVNAIVSEVFRWNSVVPLGVPHMAMEDGVVNGYLIPKGSIIVTNLWNMLHDPETYPDPFKFDPERHIATPEKPAQQNPRTICFGYGRRICPGMHLAESSLFAGIAGTLAVLNISKVVENGVEITPVFESTSGIISYPEHFKCAITPRSEKAVSLINEEHL